MSKRNKNIFIIHFQPLERYPPVMNLINYFVKNSAVEINVISTKNNKAGNLKTFNSGCNSVKIKRTATINPGSFLRIINYLYFYLYALYLLIWFRPNSVLYFETISSWPALMYKKLRGGKVKLFVHYHEYSTLAEYNNNMKLVRWMHRIETKFYLSSYEWISHTNEIRLQNFIEEHSLQSSAKSQFYVMPNYPSKFWGNPKSTFTQEGRIKLVYVGSLGFDNMYLKEIVEWVISNKKMLSLNFYCYNLDTKAKEFLLSVKDENNIYFSGTCNYEDLPKILNLYDVGLVLYKPYNFNHTYGISNKVFEYLACGLDVWFPENNQFCNGMARSNVYPKVIAVNFNSLDNFDFKSAINKSGLNYKPNFYYYENIYEEIYSNMIESYE